jgi:hypothetical protein
MMAVPVFLDAAHLSTHMISTLIEPRHGSMVQIPPKQPLIPASINSAHTGEATPFWIGVASSFGKYDVDEWIGIAFICASAISGMSFDT